MRELRDHQHEGTEGQLQFHSQVALMAQILVLVLDSVLPTLLKKLSSHVRVADLSFSS